MDQNGGEMGTLNQNGQLPVGVTVWYTDVFCVSGHDTYKMSFMDVHVGGWALSFVKRVDRCCVQSFMQIGEIAWEEFKKVVCNIY